MQINIKAIYVYKKNDNIMIIESSADKNLYTNMIFQEYILYYITVSL